MASETPAPLEGQVAHADVPEGAQKPPVKRSWRRKYRKMRAKFEDTMSTSNQLIKDEFRAMSVARRLQGQNDQLLDMLIDMNETGRLPATLRFDLRKLAENDPLAPSLHSEADPEALQQKLQELRTDMVNGILTPEEFVHKSDKLHTAQSVITNRTLSSLAAKVPHSSQTPDPAPEGIILGEHGPGYMSPAHEEEYLLAVDVALADPHYDPNARDGRPLRVVPARPVPTDKDLHIQNPDSVYNWLRKHQPQVFLQDKDPSHPENMSEKSSARTAPGRKRPSAVHTSTPGPKGEPDDEDGFPETGGKGRRGKGEDDGAYRPKGGSSRPAKRKRDDGDTPAKGGRKKNRTSAGVAPGA
ncbi:hypothetical protein K491DRAFT_305201 [Lophiostoma macrostomum CBS 122681]|uniref:IEC3 subunit of the Ino80 complex, chromatin re-modelling-domain-containing protein n=1 Tax=Lophiostoma macrostomum CBS 122681 TaxID=1314788 RepID=A0A6A6TGX8_9PLEO|nr:hypothetical protein K491DRAFT_305201 [Lophiostoma macrostomum CBS 122681]